MMELSEKELLLLDNFMYISASADSKKTIGEAIEKILANGIEEKDISGGISAEEAQKILQEIQNNENIKDLKINASIDNDGVRASCFVDNQGNATVAFRGTGGSYQAWEDNLLGEYNTDTKYQQQAAEFIQKNCSAYDSITVTGHSKGGNLAQYCTVVCGDQIDRCISYDGQGFNQDFLRKYADEIAANQEKITSLCADGDYVNLLLTSIAGKTSYLETEEEANAHASWQLYLKNKNDVDANGNFTNTTAQTDSMQKLDRAADILVAMLGSLPNRKERAIVNMLASDVGVIFAIGSGQFEIEELCDWALTQTFSSAVTGFYSTFLGKKVGFYENLYETITDAYDELTNIWKKKQDAAVQTAGTADFFIDCGKLKGSVEEFAAMEAELDVLCSRLEAIDLPGELGRNRELNQTLKTLLAEVREEKNSMKQMKEVLDASIRCYQETERRLVSQAFH